MSKIKNKIYNVKEALHILLEELPSDDDLSDLDDDLTDNEDICPDYLAADDPISFSEDGEVGISDVGNDDDAVVHDEEHTVDDAEIDDDEANNNDDKNDDEESDHQDKIRLSDTYDWLKSDLSYENSNFDSHFILPFTL